MKLALGLVGWVLAAVALANPLNNANEQISQRSAQLDVIAGQLTQSDVELLELRDELRSVIRTSESETAPLRVRLEQVTSDLDRIGPPPEDNESPEVGTISEQRALLNDELSQLNGALRQADLNVVKASRLIAEIGQLRRDQFSNQLFAQSPSVLSLKSWQNTVMDWPALAGIPAQLRSQLQQVDAIGVIWIVSSLMLTLAGTVLTRSALAQGRLLGGNRRSVLDALPRLTQLIRACIYFAPAGIGVTVITLALHQAGLLARLSNETIQLWVIAIVGIFMVNRPLLKAISPPSIDDDRRLNRNTLAAVVGAVTLACDSLALQTIDALNGPAEWIWITQTATSLVLALVIIRLCAPAGSGAQRRIRAGARLIALASLVAMALGWLALAQYVTTRLAWLIAVVALTGLARQIVRETLNWIESRSRPQPSHDEPSVLFFWLALVLDALVVVLAVPPALLILGAEWSDVRDGVSDVFFGIQVGNFTLSIASIVTAVALFAGFMYLTRVIQHTAQTRFFPMSRIDHGAQNSLTTIIGYVGLVIAVTGAVGALGFDLSNLAIIAGALSLGIGFGLQSIVNNFVSGLILLFERPIKVGDWIVTSSGEGLVKRISVRSTEIETFDYSSVLVPNSELISGAVTNWTHKNKLGRVIVPVGVSYQADPESVMQLLNTVVRSHPEILDTPEPFIYFADFADNSLNFEVRGYIRDVGRSNAVKSQLRVAIFKALKQAGIEIPFPQRDVWIRSSGT